jgi:hypothetical protein
MLIEYHEKYMRRVATLYLDAYKTGGFEEAQAFAARLIGDNQEFKVKLAPYIKELGAQHA